MTTTTSAAANECARQRLNLHTVSCLLLLAAVLGANEEGIIPTLPTLSIDSARISVSGLSSGADMAAQFIVAYSKSIMGVGVFAGNPWNCAVTRFPLDRLIPTPPHSQGHPNYTHPCEGCPPNMTIDDNHCKNSNATFVLELVDVALLKKLAQERVESGQIDDMDNLQRARVYTYAGTKDGSLGATMATHKFFRQFVPEANALAQFSIPSGHCWPQDKGINNCGLWPQNPWSGNGNPWPLENCGYDGPGVLLNHVYGKLKPAAEEKVGSHLHLFDQSPFNNRTNKASATSVGLGKLGLLYVPANCAAGSQVRCALHVVFHGCQNPFFLEYPEMNEISYNRWAETNDIVILYPHMGVHGPKDSKEEQGACWDSYGETGRDYDTKQGIQMKAIAAMIETLAGKSFM